MHTHPRLKLVLKFIWLPLLLAHFVLAYDSFRNLGLDKDELITFENVLRDFGPLIANRLERGHAPLYFIITSAWIKLTAPTHAMLIFPTVIFGWGAVLGFVWLARRLGWGPWSWLVGIALWSHPTFFYFVRYARPWMAVLCVWIWILVCWTRLLDRDAPTRHWLRWTAAFWLLGLFGALLNHTLILLWLVLALVTALLPDLRRQSTRKVYWAFLVAILAHLTMTGIVILHAAGLRAVSWIQPPPWEDLLELAGQWLAGPQLWFSLHGGSLHGGPPLSLVLMITMVVLLLAGLLELLLPPRLRPANALLLETPWKRTASAVVCLTGLAPAMFLLASPLFGQPLTLFRYGFIILPGILMLACRGVKPLRGRALPLAVLCLLIALNFASFNPAKVFRNTGMRICIERLRKKFESGDAVVVFTGSGYYALRLFFPEYPIFWLDRSFANKTMWGTMVRQTAAYKRIWVYDLYEKGGIIKDPRFRQLMGKPDISLLTKGCRLFLYNDVPAKLPHPPVWPALARDDDTTRTQADQGLSTE